MEEDWQRSNKAKMTLVDADLIEGILLEKGQNATGVIDILEWGSGQSTIYYTQFLATKEVNFRWITVEHNRSFFLDAIHPKLNGDFEIEVVFVEEGTGIPNRVEIERVVPSEQYLRAVVFDKGVVVPHKRPKDRHINMDEYVFYPSMLGVQFDVLIIDGRKRRQCLIEASRLMKANGLTLLHDAYRQYYHCAFTYFTYGQHIGDWLWLGTHSKSCFEKFTSLRDS